MELLKLYSALFRRRWLVLQSVVFFTISAVILAFVLPKNYTATARVYINSSDASLSILSELGLGEVASGLNSASDEVADKIQLVTTRPILDEVIWKLQLRDSDGKLYTPDQILVAGLTGELEAKPHLEVTQQQSTALLVFEARAGDAELSRLLADTAVKVAVAQAEKTSRDQTRDARSFVLNQLDVVQVEFDKALAAISDQQAADQVIDLESEMKAAISRLSELMLEGEQNAASIQEIRARLAEAQGFQGQESPDRIGPATVSANPQIESLRKEILSLQQERAAELRDKTAQHPDILKLDALIALNQNKLVDALAEQHALDPSVQALTAQLSGLIEKGAEIQASIRRTTEVFGTYPDKIRNMAHLQLAADAAQEVYKSLVEESYQIGIAEALLMSDLQFIEPAVVPDKPSSPKVLVNLVIGLFLGSLFGLGLALLFEYIDDTVKTPEDVVELWPLSRLGLIPKFKLAGGRRIIDGLSATEPLAEAYRAVRGALRYASLDRPLRVVAVSSALPGEGKSTLVMNLAISLAREGGRVLVVDADLRRPTQHRAFPTTANTVGLTQVLAGQVPLADAIQPTPVEGLSLLASGPTPPDPGRLVESQRLRDLLAELAPAWDLVLVDTPPALVVGDALALAPAADALVLVVASQQTPRKLLTDLRQRLDARDIHPIGFVLNRMNFQAAGYGSYLKVYKHYDTPAPKAGGAP